MGDGTGLAEALLGLTGVGVLGVDEMPGELVVTVETTTTVVGCVVCGTRAVAHERIDVAAGGWIPQTCASQPASRPACPTRTSTRVCGFRPPAGVPIPRSAREWPA